MMLVSLISYIDRNTLALLAPTILKESGLNAQQYGFIISGFSVAYMLGNPFWGRILDLIGLRRGMTAAVSIWTLASASHAFARGFFSFGAARIVLGLGEGATFPGGLRTVVQTLPPASRSRGIALAYSGGALGAVITPIIITPIAQAWGWRGAFWFTGFVGLAWLVAWTLISRRPEIRDVPKTAVAAIESLSFKDARLWSFMFLYALGGLPLAFVLYGSSLYLAQVLGKTQSQIGAVLWVPPLGWEIGYFFWGWFIDRFVDHGASIPRMRVLLIALALLSAPLAATTIVASYPVALFVMCFSMFIGAGFIIAAMAYATGIYSTRHSGFIAGLGAGSWSAIVALMMPYLGRLFDARQYGSAFAIAAALPLAGTSLWLILNRTPAPRQ